MLRRLVTKWVLSSNSSIISRLCAGESSFESNKASKEQSLGDQLKKSLPGITYISIEDISGGCGAMYEINIEAKEFEGLSTIKQHRLVTESLKKEIADMHGVRIHTATPKTDS